MMRNKRLAVIGSPIAHSLSPLIHLTAVTGCTYDKIEVKKGGLKEFLEYARENLDGFNLTMPHKEDVIPFLDEMSDDAKRFSSVNTVKVIDKKLYGYSTDAKGYIESLVNKGYDPKGKKIVFLGAGGVTEPLIAALSEKGAGEITVLNRTVSKAEAVVKNIENAKAMPLSEISVCCRDADILINGTPVGMEGVDAEFEDLDFLKGLRDTALVSDLIYAPRKTKLLRTAEELGYQTMNGLDMLIFQAILADEIFFDEKLDIYEIYKKVIKEL